MTPALLLALLEEKIRDRELDEMPLAQVSFLLYSANRGPGDPSKGIPPSPVLNIDHFRVFLRKKPGSLAAKDANPGGIHVLSGAVCDRAAWEAFSSGEMETVEIEMQPRVTGRIG